MFDTLVAFLEKQKGPLAAEDICRNLSLSRAALWKQIQALREAGYDIVTVPHQGYRLYPAADRLSPAQVQSGLRTKYIGRTIHYFARLATTMDAARRFAQQGAAEGTVVLAETQTRGRGRLGRSWISPAQQGLYLSLVLRPQVEQERTPLITLLAAVSVCEAIRRQTNRRAEIKWPNDIVIGQRKVGGILTESHHSPAAARVVIVGIGLNVNGSTAGLADNAVSLQEADPRQGPVQRIPLLQELLRRFEERYQQFGQRRFSVLADDWRRLSVTLGRRVKVLGARGSCEGQAVDIDADGGLLLRRDSGLVEKYLAGDVVHVR